MSEYLARFASLLTTVSDSELRSDPTLDGRLILERADNLVVSYAPFEYIQSSARIVIIGITPGAQQASNALCEARRKLLVGADHTTALASAKVFASFSGPLRTNLVAMLDYIGLAQWLGVSSTELLWGEHERLVHFTSALRYPVFVAGANYNGQPPMTSTAALRKLLDSCLREEAAALPGAVWVPLGPKASQGVQWLVSQGALDGSMVLDGFPHPSGANAERIAYFLGRKVKSALSAKTDAAALDRARDRLTSKIARLMALEAA